MVRIRIKLRLSTVSGKAGTIYYQVSHKKEVKHITTNIRLLPEEWDGELGRVRKPVFSEEFRLSAVQRQLDHEFGQLRQLVESFESLFAVQGQAGITVWPLAGFESHFGGENLF